MYSKKQWDPAIDWIKVISMLFIIITHYDWADSERIAYGFPYYINLCVAVLMVVTGYNYYNSFDCGWDWKKIRRYLCRILIPFIPVVIIEDIGLLFGQKLSLREVALTTFRGGYGPGSYYTPVMIQIIIVFPFFYWVVKKYKFGFIIPILVDLIFEMVVGYTGINAELYRLLAIRYTHLLAIGCQFAKISKESSPLNNRVVYYLQRPTFVLLLTVIGLKLTHWNNNINTGPFFLLWKGSAPPNIVLASAYFLMGKILGKRKVGLVEVISKASFHIFLVQMVWYDFVKWEINHHNLVLPVWTIIVNILVCFTVGILYYQLEAVIRKICLNNIKKKGNTMY